MSPAKVGNATIYKGRSGQWTFVAHRISGFLVFFFLLLHIIDVSLINVNPELYDEVHKLYGNVFLRLFTLGLLFALLFHAMNGLRIIAVDFFPKAVKNERVLTGWALFLTLALGIPASWVIMYPWIEGVF